MERAEKVKPVIVHKDGAEGVLEIDALNGAILTQLDFRPDWADGLATALLQERHTFYETRLGKNSEAFKSIMAAEAIEFADLGWLGVNEDQQEIEVSASDEFRQDAIAKYIGVDREEGTLGDDVSHEREVDSQRQEMTAEQHHALRSATEQGFSDQQAGEEQKRATAGK